jgi:hypothetical protein
MKNPCPCPRCWAPAMSDWEPDPAAIVSGNTHRSVCRECGATEKRCLSAPRPGPLRNELQTRKLVLKKMKGK